MSDLRSLYLDTPLLMVPYIRQEGLGAMRFRNDCGAACIAMFLGFAGLPVPTVDSLAAETTLVQIDNGLRTDQLQTLAGKHGLKLRLRNDLTLPEIRKARLAGSPALMLIKYGYIAGRQNQADLSGHFIVIVGEDDQFVYIMDPDHWYPKEDNGRLMAVPQDQIANAIRYASPPFQGLVLS